MMLSHERHRQHRSFLQTSKSTRNMVKQPALGTLSPETTTSSGYSTGGSSVSTSVNQSLKKSSSIQQKSHLHQEQKTKSKGKREKKPRATLCMHVVQTAIYALAISIVPLQMTFTRYFSSMYLSLVLCSNKAEETRKKKGRKISASHNYCNDLSAFVLRRDYRSNYFFVFFLFSVNIDIFPSSYLLP